MSAGFVRKHACLRFILIVIAGIVFVMCSNSYAQSSKKVGQLRFQVPEDWPIEKRGGLMTPISTEEYVSFKFQEIEKEFLAVKDDFARKHEGLESNLKNVEDDILKEFKKLQAQSEEQIRAGVKITDFLSSIGLLRDKIDHLDKVMSKRIKEVESKLNGINLQLEFIGDNLDGLQTQIYRLDEKVDYFHEDAHRPY
ncbi:MAG: hypothetical protein KAS66_01395 [Candidatus Omnitrophica bacterium]|nr:hypothetical protein [Candidatus Omnitrophota bacterium]